jgi:GNAT superfamily N-acetyltransferase
MASTEVAREHALGLQHLAGCLALSQAANWNQNEADWRLMLGFGRGYGLTLGDGTLAASTITLPYGERFAWVSMVLVLPEHRRKGYASQLLNAALADLGTANRAAILDATPAGRAVYAQEGFTDDWTFKRFSLQESKPIPTGRTDDVRAIEPRDWPAIEALDSQAFGADRMTVLTNLAERLPQAALVAERNGELAGFLLGREGREACQLGPLVARDAQSAHALLAAGLASAKPPLYLDLVDRESALGAWLGGLGFTFQRPFTRMVHGADHAPGDARLVFCPAGPELG